MKYLFDTNTCIAVMRNQAQVMQRLSEVAPEDCAISSVTAYELFTGVEKCAKPESERTKVEKLLKTVNLLPFDALAAIHSARIRAALEKAGLSIGPYDLLIAGHAVSAGLVLITHNTSEFSRVPTLTIEDWQSA